MYSSDLKKLIGDTVPFSNEIEAVVDNSTDMVNAPDSSSGNPRPVGDLNAILQALLNNDVALKAIADGIIARNILAGNGLTGGGALSGDVTLNVVSADDGITVSADNLKLNVYDGVDGTSTTRAGSARAVKMAYDAAVNATFVPPVGTVIMMKNTTDPNTVYPGTIWSKIEGRIIRATEAGQSPGTLGGSDSKTLTVPEMPTHSHEATTTVGAHTHTANHGHTASQEGHTHTRGTMDITGSFSLSGNAGPMRGAIVSGAFYAGTGRTEGASQGTTDGNDAAFQASRAWTGETSSVAPAITVASANVTTSSTTPTGTTTIANAGSGASFSIVPAYIALNIWERTA